MPVLVKEREVQKQPVEDRQGRITKAVHERATLVDEPLFHDEVAITRVPIQRVADGPVPVREKNGRTIIAIVEEVPRLRPASPSGTLAQATAKCP